MALTGTRYAPRGVILARSTRKDHAMAMTKRVRVILPASVDRDVQEYHQRHPHLLTRSTVLRSLIVQGLRASGSLTAPPPVGASAARPACSVSP